MFEPEKNVASEPVNELHSFEALFSEAHCSLPGRIQALQSDVETVEVLMRGESGIKTIDFDGQKYHLNDAGKVKMKIFGELTQAKEQLQRLEENIFRFFHKKAAAHFRQAEFRSMYEKSIATAKESDEDGRLFQELQLELQLLYLG